MTNVPITTRVWVVFSIPMDRASAEAAFSLDADDADVPGTFTWANENMVFTPDAMLEEHAQHRIRIAAEAKSPDGQPLGEGFESVFSTGTDVQVANVFPPDLATGVGTDTSIEITFSSAMDADSVEAAFEVRSDHGPVAGALSWEGDTVTFVPDETLLNATIYTVTVARRAKEVGGSAMRESFVSMFETLRTVPVVTGERIADRPTWTWTAPADRTGFRYQLDGTDGEWTSVSSTVTSYAPTSPLPEGDHTLFVQARYNEDDWSVSGSWTTLIGPILDGDLIVEGPDDLVDLRWLRVTGDVRIQGPGVMDVLGLERIIVIDGDLLVSDTRDLTTLEGLAGLEVVGGALRLMFNSGLTSLEGLAKVERIDGGIEVSMDGTDSLVGLESLETIGSLSIFNAFLPNMAGLEQVRTIEGSLSCVRASFDPTGLDSLTTIGGEARFDRCSVTSTTGFGMLEAIEGDLRVFESYFASLEAFGRLERIGGDLRFAMASGLSDLTGLGRLTSIGGDLDAQDGGPSSLAGLESLAHIGGDLRLTMVSVPDLTGLSALTAVDGSFELVANWQLVTLEGVDALETVGGRMWIESNRGLTSLRALSALTSLGEDLDVSNNMSLPTCEAEALRDRLEAAGWTGDAQISGNDDTATCN
jgi:hypothetical protein